MYNGIGLKSARGSGTSGHVQKNLAALDTRPKRVVERERKVDEEAKKRARTEIDQHQQRRQVMLKCAQLREQLEDDDVSEDEINTQVESLKRKLLQPAESVDDAQTKRIRKQPVDKEDNDVKTQDKLDDNADSLSYKYKPRYSERPAHR